MDVISFSEAATANSRIEIINANPDSSSGIITVPKVIESTETITIPAGRVAILPNVQVDGVINIEGEVFVPSGSTYGDRVMYEKINYIATQGQTVFSVNYDLGSVDVYVNGIRLANMDFTATSLTDVTIASGLNAGDIVELVSFGAFTVANTYTKAETDNGLSFKANTADLKEIGVCQTWQDVTASRALSTTYTNTTGKPILISISNYWHGNNGVYDYITVDGVVVVKTGTDNSSTTTNITQLAAIVPNGSTYSVTALKPFKHWGELR